jgi:hypothetical protein
MNKFIKSSKDLETTYQAKRSGFLEIALRKNPIVVMFSIKL